MNFTTEEDGKDLREKDGKRAQKKVLLLLSVVKLNLGKPKQKKEFNHGKRLKRQKRLKRNDERK